LEPSAPPGLVRPGPAARAGPAGARCPGAGDHRCVDRPPRRRGGRAVDRPRGGGRKLVPERADSRGARAPAAGAGSRARVSRLRPLAQGKAGALATQLRDAAAEEPYLTLRFIRQLVEKVEAEEGSVRRANVPLLKLLVENLASIQERAGKSPGAHAKVA